MSDAHEAIHALEAASRKVVVAQKALEDAKQEYRDLANTIVAQNGAN